MTPPRPFAIHVPDETLADLRGRLERTHWPDDHPGGGWQYGSDLTYMKTLVAYWREKYDWRTHEARLNRLPQFVVRIGEIDLHFIHEPGVGPEPLPLLVTHGWPGSIVEFWPYWARRHEPWPINEQTPVRVPTAYASFPREILHPPRAWVERTYPNLRRWTSMAAGGHFAALEEPGALAADIRAFFRDLR